MAKQVEFKQLGFLRGHADWVTSIVTNQDQSNGELVISGSRDKSIIVWKLFKNPDSELAGQPRKQLKAHSHFISDLALSNDNKTLLSASWDKELRFWDLNNGVCTRRFTGNTKEVFTCAMSPDNRQIVAGGAEKKFKLYNVLAELKHTQQVHFHSDWISQIRYSPIVKAVQPYVVTVGWDGWLKIWNQNFSLRFQFRAHESQINAVAINPSGEYIATGGRDKKVYIWNITDLKKPAFEFEAGGIINSLAFHPQEPWIVAGTDNEIRVWQVSNEDKADTRVPIATLEHHSEISKTDGSKKTVKHSAVSLSFDALGQKFYAGFTDGSILVWEVSARN